MTKYMKEDFVATINKGKMARDGILKSAFIDAYYEFSHLVEANLLWILLSLPIITAPGAIAGLYYTTSLIATNQKTDWRTFVQGFRELFWLGWRWAGSNLLVILGLIVNIWFYGQTTIQWKLILQALFLGLLLFWFILQTYSFPILLQQRERKVLIAYRNSLVLVIKKPWLGLALFIILLVLVIISLLTGLPWLLFTGGLAAYLSNRVVLNLVQVISEPKEAE